MGIDRATIAHLLCRHDKARSRCAECRDGAAYDAQMEAANEIRIATPKPTPGTYVDHVTLTVIIEAESMNKASHWASAYRIRKELRAAAEDAWKRAGRPKFIGPVRLSMKLYAVNGRRDPYNLLAMSYKGILDGLVNCGCLPGDAMKHIKPPKHPDWWTVDKKAPRIELRIEAVNEKF